MDELTARAQHIFWFADDHPDYPMPAGQIEFEIDLIARLAELSPDLGSFIYELRGHSRVMTPRGFHLLFKSPEGSIHWPREGHATIDGPQFWFLPEGSLCISMFHIDAEDTARLEGVVMEPLDWPNDSIEVSFIQPTIN